MKIGISLITNVFIDNGTSVRPKRIAEILEKCYDVHIITRANEKHKLGNVTIDLVKPEGTKLYCFKLIPILFKNDFDLIYCSHDFFGFLTFYLFSILFKYKIIFEVHSVVSEELKERKANKFKVYCYQILEKFVVKRSDYVIALSENTLDFYSRYNSDICLIPVFVDETLFKPSLIVEKEFDSKLIGLIGPFHNFSNEYFLEFLYNNLDNFDKRIEFIIIGKCKNKIENERITYTDYLEKLEDYIKIISSLDAVLIPSKIATMGPLNKIIETMSCSIPIFTTPKGMVGLYDVEKNRDILVFSEKELIGGLNNLIFNDELMKEVGKNARLIVEKTYSKKSVKKKLLKIIRFLESKNEISKSSEDE